MKVVCESCQAKYQVPDERVAGKKLKIRCKRCGATVLIRGDLVGVAQADPASRASLGNSLGFGNGSDTQGAGDFSMSSPPGPGALGSIAPVSVGSMSPASAPPYASDGYGAQPAIAGYEWHVSLDGDTRGPFGIEDLRAWLNATPGGWDAHVWREGFHDWVEARTCAELDPPPAPAVTRLQDDEQPTQTFQVQSPQGSQFLSDVSGAAQQSQRPSSRPVSQVSAAPARARRTSVYPETSSSPRVNAAHLADANERHDESVLFHTASLQTMTSGHSSAPAPTYVQGPNPGFASGEGSGLIDIRALASLARQSTAQVNGAKSSPSPAGATNGAAHAARATNGAAHAHASNGANGAAATGNLSASEAAGISFGNDAEDEYRGRGNAGLSSAFARVDSLAPVAHTPTSNAALPLAILGGCALVAAAVLAAVLFTRSSRGADVAGTAHEAAVAATTQPNMPAEHEATPGQQGHSPGNGSGVADAKAEQQAAEEEGEGEEDALAAGKAKRQPRSPRTPAEEKKAGAAPDEKAKPKKEEKAEPEDSPEAMLAERAKPVKANPAPAAEVPTTPATPATPATNEGDDLLAAKQAAKPLVKPQSQSIDDLMGTAADKPTPAPAAAKTAAAPAPVAAPAESNDLPDTPSRDEIMAAMKGVESAVRACATPAAPVTGTVEAAFTVTGSTGRVTQATVNGITGDVASCVEKAIKGARFPHFTKQTFSIKYPYRF